MKVKILSLVVAAFSLIASAVTHPAEIDFKDPADNIEAWVKLDGDTSGKEALRFGRLIAYGMPADKLGQPLFEMISIRKVAYRNIGGADYESQQWACGLYADPATREFIDELVNPYTGETIKLKPYCSNISGSTYTVEKGLSSTASFSMESTVFNKPYILDWNVVGDIAVINRSASTKWNEKSSGKTKIESSVDTYTAKLSDLSNSKLTSVPATYQYTLATEWMSMLKMGDRAGSMLWVGSTTKHFDLSEIPADVIAAFEKRVGKDVLKKPLTWAEKEQVK